MSFWELLLSGLALAMDAFAVSVCKGLSVGQAKPRHMATVGLYFGGFQALMPLLGYLLGSRFEQSISSVDHWVAFALLALIGLNMVRESRGEGEHVNDSFGPRAMLPLAIATSVDALVVGVTLAILNVDIVTAMTVIGVVTFLMSAAGLKIGSLFGARWRSPAELAGGVALTLMGVKILLEHLGVL